MVKKAVHKQKLSTLALGALGVVFGDIGTSPLYAFRQSLRGLPAEPVYILGLLSLIFWALILVISIKYAIILLRADNEGEGGILALLALIKRTKRQKTKLYAIIGILGVGLMMGDGMLTPAISVISAIEGIGVYAPQLSHWIVPITCAILILLFSIQWMGTEKIGFIFGPILLAWFIILAILGVWNILDHPMVLKAVNPYYAYLFFQHAGWQNYVVLGGVFLVVTGGEALYADLGHFGKLPMRWAWFGIVLPCLVLNYFGQGANVIEDTVAVENPFFTLAPAWFLIPLIIIATLATIIASQAVITATFSLIKQAILLFYYPQLPIIQTSKANQGQIYIPQVNIMLGIGTLIFVLFFKSSAALSHAYGIAINLLMILTSLLLLKIASQKWQWGRIKLTVAIVFFGTIDLTFLVANIDKLETGGWIPIVFALGAGFLMMTWHQGIMHLHKIHYLKKNQLTNLLSDLDPKKLNYLPQKTSIFVTDVYDTGGGNFLRFLKMNAILPEHIIIINFLVKNVPYVPLQEKMQLTTLNNNVYKLTLHYGFMDTVSIPQALALASKKKILPFTLDVQTATYFIEISNVVASPKKKTLYFFWQEKLFAFLTRHYSANLNIDFYQLPYERTVAIGAYYVI